MNATSSPVVTFGYQILHHLARLHQSSIGNLHHQSTSYCSEGIRNNRAELFPLTNRILQGSLEELSQHQERGGSIEGMDLVQQVFEENIRKLLLD
jgi:hypothetical protein